MGFCPFYQVNCITRSSTRDLGNQSCYVSSNPILPSLRTSNSGKAYTLPQSSTRPTYSTMEVLRFNQPDGHRSSRVSVIPAALPMAADNPRFIYHQRDEYRPRYIFPRPYTGKRTTDSVHNDPLPVECQFCTDQPAPGERQLRADRLTAAKSPANPGRYHGGTLQGEVDEEIRCRRSW
jgi:hypothetical protein